MGNFYDVIIVGSGIAGLWSGYWLNKLGYSVLIVTKREVFDANSFYAQGGVTLALNREDVPLHIEDTLKAGWFHNNREMVELMSRESLHIRTELKKLGFHFDPGVTREGAHSVDRVFHKGGDATGRELHLFLLQRDPNYLMDNTIVYDILMEEDRVYGVRVVRKGEQFNLYCNHLILASGGIGALYKYDTNARTIAGELQGIAIKKGLPVRDMEMTQFHPTVFIQMEFAQKLLISEAVRGEGGKVVDEKGERFLFKYDPRGELASRDIISRAIYLHQKAGHKVFLDVSHFSEEFFSHRFPTIYKKLRNYGIKVPKQKIPISPAFHYHMGGIEVEPDSRVKGTQNLFAVGEVAYTGVHGANRLASNSLLECFVFGKRVAEGVAGTPLKKVKRDFPVERWLLMREEDKKWKNKLREIMWEKVGIIRNKKGLEEALEFITSARSEVGELTALRFITAKEIVKGALNRHQSLGAHYIETDSTPQNQ
ncbi:MAG: L-aspartate oxidase [Epsilonproteobacteria bacterium]|nr:L-aspartate oxidase [Campylobacterota bacterium]NPA88997.1 FAD-dependent oxidoreductase [Campylobacterota bacterium]